MGCCGSVVTQELGSVAHSRQDEYFEYGLRGSSLSPVDMRLSQGVMLKDAQKSSKTLDQLGPFQLADDSKHEWRPKMFENHAGDANLKSNKACSYSVTSEVKWWVKLKTGFVPQCLLEPVSVFATTRNRDNDNDPAFMLVESPQYPVTLEADAKQICNIPSKADQFSFIYPVADGVLDKRAVEKAINGPKGEEVKANLGLLQVGGYAYWEGANAFPALALRPLILADVGLTFSLPRDMALIGDRNMEKKMSWHDVTLPFLQELGVKSFTWLNPCRPDLLPHLNYYHVRADLDLFIPDRSPYLGLTNVHKIEQTSQPYWNPKKSQIESLQVTDVKGTRAKPEVLHALSQFNLRDTRNGHRYQFAENGAFAYKMLDGSIRYFDVVDTFIRPAALNLSAQAKLWSNPKYKHVCDELYDCIDKCATLPIGKQPPTEWQMTICQWNNLARGLEAVQKYEAMLIEHYDQESDKLSKLDSEEIAKLCNARRDELISLDDLLEPRPRTRMATLGPIALMNSGWQAIDFNLDFDGTSQADLANSTPDDAVKKFQNIASSFKEVTVHVLRVPSTLTLQELGYDSNMQLPSPFNSKMSLISPITLPVLSRHRAGIPLAATHFGFFYPTNDPRVSAAENSSSFKKAQHENELSLLLLGGFIYLNDRGQIVEHGIKTLKFGSEGLRFSEARDFNAFVEASLGLAKARGSGIEDPLLTLESKQWWHHITASALRSMQVSHFTWLPPCPAGQTSPIPGLFSDGLPLADAVSGKAYVLGEHGSFLYKCEAEIGRERVVHFDVLADPSAALFAQLEELEQFRDMKDMIELMKRRLLGFTVENNSMGEIHSQTLVDSIVKEQRKSAISVAKMLADYVRAISDLQVEHCVVCMDTYGLTKPRRTFRVCKHTVCSDCEERLSKCPQCNVPEPMPKLHPEEWLQSIDEPDKLTAIIANKNINIAELWWRKTIQCQGESFRSVMAV